MLHPFSCVRVAAHRTLFVSCRSRQVDIAEGERLAKAIGCAFVETSAKEDINVSKYHSIPSSEGFRV